jgi:hypothetical protein
VGNNTRQTQQVAILHKRDNSSSLPQMAATGDPIKYAYVISPRLVPINAHLVSEHLSIHCWCQIANALTDAGLVPRSRLLDSNGSRSYRKTGFSATTTRCKVNLPKIRLFRN